MVHTNCNIFEICDHAVLLSGGWNRQTTGVRFKNNLESFYWMLRQNGFKKSNIKTFYANGATGINGKITIHQPESMLKSDHLSYSHFDPFLILDISTGL